MFRDGWSEKASLKRWLLSSNLNGMKEEPCVVWGKSILGRGEQQVQRSCGEGTFGRFKEQQKRRAEW